MSDRGYYRHPTIAGDLIVFACEDDLWSVPRAGGLARRLTAASGEISTPRLSPDGTRIAFVGRDEGGPELSVMAAEGGPATRLTHLGAEVVTLCGWSADGGSIHFTSDAGSAFVRETLGYRVSASGGAAEPLRLGHMKTFSMAADGRIAIGRNNDDPARWKRYRGGTAGDLWIDADGSGEFRRLISLPGNLVWPIWVGERIVFLSDHEGVGNLYSVRPDGSDLRRLTEFTDYYVRYPSSDGATVVFTAGAELYALDAASGKLAKIEVRAPSPAPQTARRFLEVGDEFESFAPSPDGTSLALVARGRPITMPLWEEAAVVHGAGSSVRYREAQWLPDGARFVVVSDEGGRERLEIRSATGESWPEVALDEEIGRVVELAASPSADLVALANHRRELLLVDLADHRVRVLDRSPAANIADLAFSPDGRWLAYAISPELEGVVMPDVTILRVAKVKSGALHDLTSPLRTDRSPAWDPDGNYLAFISNRDFNPVYDALQFDLSFPQASRPFLVTLRADVPDPFVPKPAPLHKDDLLEREERKRERKTPKIEIDFEGIAGRILAFPVEEGNYGELVAARERALFTKFPLHGIKPGLHSWDDDDEVGDLLAYDFDQQRSAVLAREVGEIRLAADNRTLVYASHERLRALDALGELPDEQLDEHKPPSEPGRRSGWLDLERASLATLPPAEWAQMYHEAWRMQREQFWDPEMSGVDWDLVRERYARLLPLVRTRSELSDLLWEMFGELGTSHAYEIGGDLRKPPAYRRGFLGADLVWDEDAQGYRIASILRGDSWDREIDSPLAEPGLGVAVGDLVIAIGGEALTRERTPDAMLVNAAGQMVALGIANGKKGRRRIVVRALRDERMLRYRSWVDGNRSFVHAQTGGAVGYVHIPDMGPWGFAEFHRGFLSEFNRSGLLVDVRYNRGGHVSPLLLEKLARKRVGYDVTRYGPPMPYPPESVAGPIVALTNQFAGSDGDIFSHVFKLYKLGPLVGKRTWGGVVGINPYHRLVDGTITTQPEFSFWFADVGWKVENYGTDPDYDIDIAPQDERRGVDPQMQKALELLAQLRAASTNGKPLFDIRPRLVIPNALTPKAEAKG